jgi:hypothetical protein
LRVGRVEFVVRPGEQQRPETDPRRKPYAQVAASAVVILMPYESWSESATGFLAAAVVALIVALVLWLT